jgi:hypothetical protein
MRPLRRGGMTVVELVVVMALLMIFMMGMVILRVTMIMVM